MYITGPQHEGQSACDLDRSQSETQVHTHSNSWNFISIHTWAWVSGVCCNNYSAVQMSQIPKSRLPDSSNSTCTVCTLATERKVCAGWITLKSGNTYIKGTERFPIDISLNFAPTV